MWQDPIVAKTRALRDEYVRQFNYDSDAIFEDLMACLLYTSPSPRD